MADGQKSNRGGPTDLRFRTMPEWTDTKDPAYTKMLHVLDEALGDLKKLGAAFGPSYQWSVGGRRRQRARSVSERNAIYWEECGDQWLGLAYARLAKSDQLITTTLSSMDRGHLVPAATCVRTLLEQAVVFEHLGKTFCETVQDKLERGINPKTDLIERPELLQLLHLAQYGTRVPEYLALGYPQQTNFLSYLQKWSKLRTGPNPDFVYHHLCDMVHPNLESELSVYRSTQDVRTCLEADFLHADPQAILDVAP